MQHKVSQVPRQVQGVAGAQAGMQSLGAAQGVAGAQVGMQSLGAAQGVAGAQAGTQGLGAAQGVAGAQAGTQGLGAAQGVAGAQAGTQGLGAAQGATGASARVQGLGAAQGSAGASARVQGLGAAQGSAGASASVQGLGTTQGGANARVSARGSGAEHGTTGAPTGAAGSDASMENRSIRLKAVRDNPAPVSVWSGALQDDSRSRDQEPDRALEWRKGAGECSEVAQDEAHVNEATADPFGQYVTKGKEVAPSALGMSLGGFHSKCKSLEGPAETSPAHTVRFRPDPDPMVSHPDPVPLGFSPDPEKCNRDQRGSLAGDATIYSLPLTALSCKAVRAEENKGTSSCTDLVVEDIAFGVKPGGVRRTEERLDSIVVELRRLCDSLRSSVLEIADGGGDCGLEVLELNRLVEMEHELVQELADHCSDPSVWETPGPGSELQYRVRHLQEDVGGGSQAEVEGMSGPPLQTKIISIEEVLRDIEEWWNPMLAEYQALVQEKQIVIPVTSKELARREAAGEAFQVIPAKLIFSIKAFTARRKVRCVGCGNYLGEGNYTANQLYAGGLDVVSLRCSLVLMVHHQWSAGVVDIKTAFLRAELEKEDLGAKRVIIRTPGLWRRLGICTETFWDVQRALYGLQISPAAWSRCRDRTLPRLRIATEAGIARLLQLKSDGNIWAIVPAEAKEPVDPSVRLGLLLVYVDDLMVLSTPQIISDVIAEIGKQWELSSPELLEEGNLHYRGIEVQRGEGGIWVHQGAYTREILSRYPDKGGADVPALKLLDIMPIAKQDPQVVRRAQQIAGELLWLSGLTRPDLMYAVATISRTISVNAEEAVGMGEQVIRYLRRHPDRGLWYQAASMEWGEEGDLSVPMGRNSLVGFCDASFAPSSSRSLQCTLGFYNSALISWSSTRQGMTTLSTAESELCGITSLFTELQALEPLVNEINGSPVALQMHSDSQAAIAICTTASSNWRTRHLRLRASYVREVLESGKYSLHHVCGNSMKADVGTKPLPAVRFQQLVQSLGMSEVARKIEQGGHNDEKVRALLVSLIVASLLQPAEGHRDNVRVEALEDPRHKNWQFVLLVAIMTVLVWEVTKWLIGVCYRRCRFGIAQQREQAAPEPSNSPGVHVVRYVDDVVIIGPRDAVGRTRGEASARLEEMTALEGPGAPTSLPNVHDNDDGPRRRSRKVVFQLNDDEFEGWPSPLSLSISPVGQDRYEHRPQWRTLLRWHLEPRIRLFNPENTRSPLAMTVLTGRRRTWIIDITEGSPNGRCSHHDSWKESSTRQAVLPYAWIGCTEFEISVNV